MNKITLSGKNRINKVGDTEASSKHLSDYFIVFDMDCSGDRTASTLPISTRFSNSERFSLEQLKINKRKLRAIKKLKADWNNYGGEAFTEVLITRIEEIISKLDYQPQIFPTGRGSIQIEKYINSRNLVEIEVSEDKIFAYQVKGGKEIEKEITASEINDLISDLYA